MAYSGGILSDQIKLYYTGNAITYSDTQPASPASGDLWFDTANKVLKKYASSAFEAVTESEMFSGSSAIYTQIPQLQSIPSLGGTTNKVDVTCLEDEAHRYINGLKDYGDSIDFTFLYDRLNYAIVDGFGADNTKNFLVQFKKLGTAPSSGDHVGDRFFFAGKATASLNEVAVDSALTFTMSIAVQSNINYAAGNGTI